MKLLAQWVFGLVIVASFFVALTNTQGPSEQEIAAHKERMIEPVVIEPEPIQEPIASTIYYSSQPGCEPCEQFKLIIPSLQDNGWLVVEKDIEGPTPQFQVVVAPRGDIFEKSGFTDKKTFYSWLQEITGKNETNEDTMIKDEKESRQNPCPPKRTRYRLFRRR